ncbi:MAG: hypothetical protein EXQ84_06350 [Rhodospirillaceae bacterium]|nr:hypothetical protein [Rhodospirillaceae bacterium]
MSFCTSGVLTVGRATTIAHESVITYLRRQDFIAEFTADIADPAEKQATITNFYKLLADSGFNVQS